MQHREALDCPCRPEARHQVGGGRVHVHRTDQSEGRVSADMRAPDRYCTACNTFHLVGHPHLT